MTAVNPLQNPIEPIITRLKASKTKLGIDAYLTEHPVDLLATIPQRKGGTDALTVSRITPLAGPYASRAAAEALR